MPVFQDTDLTRKPTTTPKITVPAWPGKLQAGKTEKKPRDMTVPAVPALQPNYQPPMWAGYGYRPPAFAPSALGPQTLQPVPQPGTVAQPPPSFGARASVPTVKVRTGENTGQSIFNPTGQNLPTGTFFSGGGQAGNGWPTPTVAPLPPTPITPPAAAPPPAFSSTYGGWGRGGGGGYGGSGYRSSPSWLRNLYNWNFKG